ncbi:hypothetical protein HOLleu_29778 [Holothuria leucospilota]|uniref:Uncharacterized protein n=1 Tax=Holothuria leucospilota TaxID=206669 RepID=A0A9Q1BJF2_HOLLE|nr:hypothetical protein HOLleu_29778 [Holothuria leucospilota]
MQVIAQIRSSPDFPLHDKLSSVLRTLGYPVPSHMWNFERKIHNKFLRAKKVGLHILKEPVSLPRTKQEFEVGELCDSSGITEAWLIDDEAGPLHFDVTNQHILELLKHKNGTQKYTYYTASIWVKKLCHLPSAPHPHTVRSNWLALYRRSSALAPYPEKLQSFLGELYRPPSHHDTPVSGNPSACQTEATLQRMLEKMEGKMAMLEGAFDHQLAQLKEMKWKNEALTSTKQDAVKARRAAMAENQRLRGIQKELEDCNTFLMGQLKSLDKVNAKRTIERRNQTIQKQTDRISQQAAEITQLQHINSQLEERLANVSKKLESDKKRLRDKICYYKKKSTASQNTPSADKELEEELGSLRNANAELQEQIEAVMANSEISSFESGKYTDEVRLVCYELLSCGVGSANVGHVIRTVLKTLAGINIGRLPKSTLVKYMATQSGLLAKAAAVSAIEKSAGYTTLHSDGTSRQNQGMRRKYVNFLVSTDSGVVATAIQDHHSADAEAQLEGTKSMFAELVQVFDINDQTERVRRTNDLIVKNKNLMQDRSSVMKNFAGKYEQWRRSVLPAVVENWKSISQDSKNALTTVNDAYCLAHPILSFQEVADKAINEWEKIETNGRKIGRETITLWNRKESATVCAIRSICKAFGPEADEAAGHPNQFQAYINGPCHLEGFRGNRFNSPFVNATASYHHYTDAVNYISTLGSSGKNLLLRCVEADFSDDIIVTGVRAMGLLERYITSPYMQLIESNIQFSDIGEYMEQLRNCLQKWSGDPTPLLNGTALLFPKFPPQQDMLQQNLLNEVSQEMEESTHILLGILCAALLGVVEKQLSDHLPGGVFYNPSQDLRKEMSTTPKDNLCAERLFGALDRIQRRMPNANTITMEGILLWAHNKTSQYLSSLPEEERHNLIETTRKMTPQAMKQYQTRKQQIKQHYRNLQLENQRKANQKILRLAETKDNIITSVMNDGGLCLTAADLEKRLTEQPPDKQRQFLLNQIKYHKTIHTFTGLEKSLFHQQNKGEKLSVKNLKNNLLKIIAYRQDLPAATSESTSTSEATPAHLDHSPKQAQFYNLKRKYLDKAVQNQHDHSGQQERKKRRFPSSDLSGQRIRHLWVIDGKDTWCKGTILRPSTHDDMVNMDEEDDGFVGHENFYTIKYDLWKNQEYVYPLQKEWEEGCVEFL